MGAGIYSISCHGRLAISRHLAINKGMDMQRDASQGDGLMQHGGQRLVLVVVEYSTVQYSTAPALRPVLLP